MGQILSFSLSFGFQGRFRIFSGIFSLIIAGWPGLTYRPLRYPKGMADNVTMAPWLESYIDNSLVVGSTQWNALVEAATKNQVYVLLGFSHKDEGALYMAQALISPDGTQFVRHKLRPSPGERGLWSDGRIEDLKVIATPYGRWGILECWEHFHPAMTFNTQAQAETLHLASWPFKYLSLISFILSLTVMI